MCFDLDSRPPIAPIAGAAIEHQALTLTAGDGNEFRAFQARPERPTGNAIIVLPDVRGLHRYYEELALRFAEAGVEALAIDYFGRTAGTSERGDEFDYGPHVGQLSWEGVSDDITSAAAYLRREDGGTRVRSLFTIGFCMGGRMAFLGATLPIDAAGVIGFYGWPAGPHKSGAPGPAEMAGSFRAPVLGIFGGADQGIPLSAVETFRAALDGAGVENEIVVEPDAPHSFFDRKAAEYRAQSDDAWRRVRGFIEAHGTH